MSLVTELPPADYETKDAPPGRLLFVAAGIAGGVLVALGTALALYHHRYAERPKLGMVGRQTSFTHSPKAQTDIAADWGREDAAVTEHLTTYGLVDQNAGVYRVPIERAMQRLVEETRTKEEKP